MKFSPEAEFIHWGLQTNISGESAVRLAALLQGEIDWSFLCRLILRHRLAPLLHQNLSRLTGEGIDGHRCPSEAIPLDIQLTLREHYALNLRRNLLLTGQLFTLLDAFEEQKIFALPYKGPIQGAFLYGQLGSRQFRDIDILVAPADVRRALELLVQRGFEAPSFLNSKLELSQYELGQSHECALTHAKTGMVVELHWRTQGLQFSREFTANDLRSRLQVTTVQGRSVPIFSPEDLLLLLSSHGARHLWWRLQWLCDVARLLATQTLNWDIVERSARQSGEWRRLLIGLQLAHQFLGAPLPQHIKVLFATDYNTQEIASRIQEAWFIESEEVAKVEGHLLVRLREDAQKQSSQPIYAPVTTIALPLSNRGLGGTLSSQITSLLDSDRVFRDLASRLRDLMHNSVDTPTWDTHQIHLRMRERKRDKLRYLWWGWLAPTDKEIKILPLPRLLRFIHVPFRFLRLTVKYGFSLIRSNGSSSMRDA
jgi:hypothetical protein